MDRSFIALIFINDHFDPILLCDLICDILFNQKFNTKHCDNRHCDMLSMNTYALIYIYANIYILMRSYLSMGYYTYQRFSQSQK